MSCSSTVETSKQPLAPLLKELPSPKLSGSYVLASPACDLS